MHWASNGGHHPTKPFCGAAIPDNLRNFGAALIHRFRYTRIRQQYTEGTMVIEAYDDSVGRVWRGVGETEIITNQELIPTNIERAGIDAVRAILKKFPKAAAAS